MTRRAPARPRGTRACARLLIMIAVAVVVSACGGSSAAPGTTLRAYLTAWSHGDWAGMRRLVARPPANFTSVNAKVFTALGVSAGSFTAGPVAQSKSGQTASAAVTEHFELTGIGAWSPRTRVDLVKRNGRWLVSWSTRTINPQLGPGESLMVTRDWPARAPILGAGGSPLTTQRAEVVVGVVGSRIKNARAVSTDLIAAGATRAEVSEALAQAREHPSYFDPVFTVTQAHFARLKAQPGPGNVYNVPGTEFHLQSARHAITLQLEDQLVGAVGPITAEQLKQLGSPYDASSVIGERGLEQIYERRLAGAPSTRIDVDDATGSPVTRLATFHGHPGRAVRTSIDPAVQRAAEAALAGDPHHVAMVAMRASTGQVLAVVSDPGSFAYDQALQGEFPPGSTFKVLTSTALIRRGLTPQSPASCPSTITIDGETFHNASADEGPVSTLEQAFTISCNTAFIGLATQHLSATDVTSAAGLYGLDHQARIGIPAFLADVPAPRDPAGLAATAIGQASVVFSPLGMATVAAAIDGGHVRAPKLVTGAAGERLGSSAMPSDVTSDLREMMADVVSSGTAAGTGLPAGTHAKTGTAQYGTGSPLKIDGWLMGYDGDIAFAIVTQDTGGQDGGPVDGPLIARFLDALGPGA